MNHPYEYDIQVNMVIPSAVRLIWNLFQGVANHCNVTTSTPDIQPYG